MYHKTIQSLNSRRIVLQKELNVIEGVITNLSKLDKTPLATKVKKSSKINSVQVNPEKKQSKTDIVYDFIKNNPGMKVKAMSKKLAGRNRPIKSSGAVTAHLMALLSENKIKRISIGRYEILS